MVNIGSLIQVRSNINYLERDDDRPEDKTIDSENFKNIRVRLLYIFAGDFASKRR